MKRIVDGIFQDIPDSEVAEIQARWAETAAKQDDFAAQRNRVKRNELLSDTDFCALSDVSMSDEMRSYRQSLRDITNHANWPNLSDDDWPTKP